MSAFFSMCVAAAMVACGSAGPSVADGSDSVLVTLDDSSYALGDTARVTVVNTSGQAVLLAFVCDASLEGQAGSEWILFATDCSHMRVRPTRLESGESAVFPFVIEPVSPTDLPQYQAFRVLLRYQHEDNAGYRFVRSSSFLVVP